MTTTREILIAIALLAALPVATAQIADRSRPVWITEEAGRVSVMARTNSGKRFSIMTFDRSLLEHGSFTGIDFSEARPREGQTFMTIESLIPSCALAVSTPSGDICIRPDGKVEIPADLPLDVASRRFWDELGKVYRIVKQENCI